MTRSYTYTTLADCDRPYSKQRGSSEITVSKAVESWPAGDPYITTLRLNNNNLNSNSALCLQFSTNF